MSLTPFEFVVVVFAAYRATRLVAVDTIAEGPRAWLDRRSPRHLGALVTCPFCAGWWLSVVAYVVAVLVLGRVHDVPVLVHAIGAWAVAGAQSILSAVDNWLAG